MITLIAGIIVGGLIMFLAIIIPFIESSSNIFWDYPKNPPSPPSKNETERALKEWSEKCPISNLPPPPERKENIIKSESLEKGINDKYKGACEVENPSLK